MLVQDAFSVAKFGSSGAVGDKRRSHIYLGCRFGCDVPINVQVVAVGRNLSQVDKAEA